MSQFSVVSNKFSVKQKTSDTEGFFPFMAMLRTAQITLLECQSVAG